MKSAIALIAGATMLGCFALIRPSVDENGYLQEPFWMLPTGFALIVGGLIGAAVIGARKKP